MQTQTYQINSDELTLLIAQLCIIVMDKGKELTQWSAQLQNEEFARRSRV